MHLTTSGRAPDDSGDGALQGQALYQGSSELPECGDWHKDTDHCSCSYRGSKGPTVFSHLICQHLHRRGVANTFWYNDARQPPRTVRADLALRESVSDSLIRNMHTSRQPEMVL